MRPWHRQASRDVQRPDAPWYGQFLYVGKLLSAVLVFIGFRVAARPQPDQAPQAVPVPGD